MANTYLTRTAGTPTSTQKGTFSAWVKRSSSADARIFTSWGGGSRQFWLNFQTDSTDSHISIADYDGSYNFRYLTNRKFRDFSAFYHIVFAIDTTLGTAGDRVKLYINGVQETSFSVSTAPSQNQVLNFATSGDAHIIGKRDAEEYFNGSMSYVAFIDGKQELPTIFGETDATTGEWKIKTTITPTSGWGNVCFFILKNGNSVTDQSGQSNNFTVGGGTLTKTEDCPSNVFPIFNGMYCPKSSTNAGAFLNGGTTVGGSPSDASSIASMGARSGKYYWEIKVQNATNTRSCGVVRSDSIATSHGSGIYPGGNGNATIWTVAYNMVNGYVQKNQNGTQSQQGSLATLTTGDILGVALNLTDYEIKWYKNNSLVATTSLSADWVAYGNFLLPCNRMDGNQFVQYNFGNGYFGTTAVASAGTNASGNGIFEYDVPSGFTALSTKGLNS